MPNTTESFNQMAIKDIVRDIKETHGKVSDMPFNEAAFVNVPSV